MFDDLWIAAGVAFALALGLAPLCAKAMPRLGLVDVPNQRSSHTYPTPRGVGLVVPLAVVVAALATGTEAPAPMAAALALAILGLAADTWDLPPAWRLAAQFLVAFGGAWALGLPVALTVPAAVVIVAAVNGANFMDGINGITALHGALFGACLALAAASASIFAWQVIGVAMAAACLGYLPNNFPVARSFPGDVLPYFLAGTYTLGLMDLAMQRPILLLGVGVLIPIALDTSVTVVRKAHGGESLIQPHRTHAYQRLARRTSHTTASLTLFALSLMCAVSLPVGLAASAATGVLYLTLATAASLAALAAVPNRA
jgi:UDP-GlcNAc:undecaprenyl-phosphate/decaprenyl-phosphate GlcNAc-1-phosphate transferase